MRIHATIASKIGTFSGFLVAASEFSAEDAKTVVEELVSTADSILQMVLENDGALTVIPERIVKKSVITFKISQ